MKFCNISFSKLLLLFLLTLIVPNLGLAHGSWEEHAKDIMNVFGFEYDGRKAPKNTEIKEDWIKFISSEMIDDRSFHLKLTENHKGFPNLGTATRHRILFHWAYDAEPWNREFERIVKEYCEIYDLNIESNLRIFKSELKSEQKRRNGKINEKTEIIFGFAHGGVDADIARFFAAMAYNVHILGDYMSADNTIITGLNDLTDLMGRIIVSLRDLDLKESKEIKNEINKILMLNINEQLKADRLMDLLKTNVPNFVKKAQSGRIYRRIEKRGFKFK